MTSQVIYIISLSLFGFLFLGVAVRFLMLMLAVFWIGYEKRLIRQKPSDDYPKVSLMIPAYNESDTIVESVTHAVNGDYPDLEVVVVNDGSRDNTLDLLIDAFELTENRSKRIIESIPTQHVRGIYTSRAVDNLVVVDKENGGKADALNCAINTSTAPYVLALDADTILTKNTIRYLVRPTLNDPRVIVTSGSVRIISEEGNSILSDLQKAEFVNSISLFRTGWNYVNANLIVSGALGLFNKNVLIRVNGYHNLAIGEDMELIIRIHRHQLENRVPYKILQLALPTCFTKAVPGIGEMIKQRKRWQKGLLSSLRLNMKLFFNPRYKSVGLLALPFYILFEVLGPFIEVFGLLSYFFLLGYAGPTFSLPLLDRFFGDWATPIWIWVAGLLFAIFNDWLSITIDKLLLRGMGTKEYLRLLFSASTSPFFYHFLQLYCKIKGTFEYFSTIQTSTRWDTKR